MSAHTPIRLTEGAAKRLLKLLQIENNPAIKFRIYITGGGCSGFQYGFGFEKTDPQPDDIIIKIDLRPFDETKHSSIETLEIIVDSMSMMYLEGAEVVYEEGLYGAHFKIKNPNAKNTCGCGNSFAI